MCKRTCVCRNTAAIDRGILRNGATTQIKNTAVGSSVSTGTNTATDTGGVVCSVLLDTVVGNGSAIHGQLTGPERIAVRIARGQGKFACNGNAAAISGLVICNGCSVEITVGVPKAHTAAEAAGIIVADAAAIEVQLGTDTRADTAAIRSSAVGRNAGRAVVIADLAAVHPEQRVVKTHTGTLRIAGTRIGVVGDAASIHIERTAYIGGAAHPAIHTVTAGNIVNICAAVVAYINRAAKIFVNVQGSTVYNLTAVHVKSGCTALVFPCAGGYLYRRSAIVFRCLFYSVLQSDAAPHIKLTCNRNHGSRNGSGVTTGACRSVLVKISYRVSARPTRAAVNDQLTAGIHRSVLIEFLLITVGIRIGLAVLPLFQLAVAQNQGGSGGHTEHIPVKAAAALDGELRPIRNHDMLRPDDRKGRTGKLPGYFPGDIDVNIHITAGKRSAQFTQIGNGCGPIRGTKFCPSVGILHVLPFRGHHSRIIRSSGGGRQHGYQHGKCQSHAHGTLQYILKALHGCHSNALPFFCG